LEKARQLFSEVKLSTEILKLCITLCQEFEVEGNRGDYVLAIAARACAAIQGETKVSRGHLQEVALLALQHRRKEMPQINRELLDLQDREKLDRVLGNG
jgi:magnesium chelatase subunit I